MASREARLAAVAKTAWWSATARAVESQRRDHLFEDPWAVLLLGPQHQALLSERRISADEATAFELYGAVTHFFDDFLLRITADGVRQVVLLASGLDTRAFRLPWPSDTKLFELEQPHVLTYKGMQLSRASASAACDWHPVGVDLNESWEHALVQSGFDPSRPCVWLLEGFLYFLPESAVRKLLGTITALSAPKSWVGLEVIDKDTPLSPATRHWKQEMADAGVPWLFSTDRPEALLDPAAWDADCTQPGMADASYGDAHHRVGPGSGLFLITASRVTPNKSQ